MMTEQVDAKSFLADKPEEQDAFKACPQGPRRKSKLTTNFYAVLAATQKGGIGLRNKLPWCIPGELKLFHEVTTRWADSNKPGVVMGRKTWQSLPCKPLPDRTNIVVSRNRLASKALNLPPHVYAVTSKEELVELCGKLRIGSCYVIGGAEIYAEMADLVEAYWLTTVRKLDNSEILADTFVDLQVLLQGTRITARTPEYTHNEFWYQQVQYTHTTKRPRVVGYSLSSSKPSWEYKYLELLHDIAHNGSGRKDGKALFGRELVLDIQNSVVPLVTTWHHDVSQVIQDVSDFFEGFSRHAFEVIELVKKSTKSRPDDRIVLGSINAHFVVDNQDLWCLAGQESVDTFSDLGHIVASLAITTHIIAQACNLNAKTLIVRVGVAWLSFADAQKVEVMLHRTPMPVCHVSLPVRYLATCSTEAEFVHATESLKSDVSISDYVCHEQITVVI
jgi:dihydrofolate reductase